MIDKSHPTWVRGLKFGNPLWEISQFLSHPTWVRGLKFANKPLEPIFPNVAPHVGAWIEISKCGKDDDQNISRTPRGCVD